MSKLSESQAAELAALAALPDEKVDTSEQPEIRDWEGAIRGKFYRPVKRTVTMRLDADVVAWFQENSDRYQTEINRVLRRHMLDRGNPGRP